MGYATGTATGAATKKDQDMRQLNSLLQSQGYTRFTGGQGYQSVREDCLPTGYRVRRDDVLLGRTYGPGYVLDLQNLDTEELRRLLESNGYTVETGQRQLLCREG